MSAATSTATSAAKSCSLFTRIRDSPDTRTWATANRRIREFISSRVSNRAAGAALAILADPKLSDVGILRALCAIIRPPSEAAPSRKVEKIPERPLESASASVGPRAGGAARAGSATRARSAPQLALPRAVRNGGARAASIRAPLAPTPARAPEACCGSAAQSRETSRVRDVEAELALAAAIAATAEGYSYLDVGCAEGRITSAVAQRLGLGADHTHACDVSPQAELAGVTFTQNGAESLPYPDASFDLITMFMSAHHFSDAGAMFAETRRVARAGALLLLREHDCQSEADMLYYDFVHALYACALGRESTPEQFIEKYAAGEFSYYRGRAEWAELAAAHGFEPHPSAEPHGPVVRGVYGTDRFDTFYALFRACDVPEA